jgi:eukaryotic-like serine/threonine-protein kinase
MIGRTLGAYHVVAKLGEGGMGEVYRATDSRLKRDVALKVLPADVAGSRDRLTRFQREAELLASLNHPHIAHVYGLEESGGTIALVMELVDGEDLSRRIARGPVAIGEALSIATQIAHALEAAHDQGIIHRDLKPSNIKVRPDGTVKVLDFGLAKSLTPAVTDVPTLTAISAAGVMIGTPAYMSPEQARGDATGPETDIWAYGVVLYEIFTGVSPFARKSTAETLAQVLSTKPDESRLPAGTPAGVRRVIRRCLEMDPRRRWRHMGDIRLELEEAAAIPGDATPSASGVSAPIVMTRRRALVYGAASVGFLAAGLAGGVLLDRRLRPSAVSPSFRRLTFRRGIIRSARFAPDGQTILFGAGWDGGRCRVHTVRIDGPESRPLDFPDGNLLAISRSGEVALSLGSHHNGVMTYGTLARVPMSGGAPRQMVEGVRFADWSPDGSDLAIVRSVDGRDRLEFPIGKVLFAPADGQGTGLGFARVSPDGQRIAFVHYQHPQLLSGRVAIVDHAGTVTPLSGDYLNIHGLAWRGNEIVYTAGVERPLSRAVCTVTPGGAARIMTQTPGNVSVWDALPDGRLVTAHTDDRVFMAVHRPGDVVDRDLSWLDASYLGDLSSDGKLLLFTEVGQGGGAGFVAYLRATDGSPAVRLGDGRVLALSPDARWAIRAPANYRTPGLELIPTGAGEPRRLADHGLICLGARWLPDGKRVVLSAIEAGHRDRLFLHDLGPDRPTALTPEGTGSWWVISPDGSSVAAHGPGSTIRIYDTNSAAAREVPGLTGNEKPVGWIPEGLLVIRADDPASPPGEIYKIDISTGRQSSWKNILPRDPAGLMSLLGIRITPDGQSHAHVWGRALSDLYLTDGLI